MARRWGINQEVATLAKGRKGKPRCVVVGFGWGGARIAQRLDLDLWDLVVVAPRATHELTPWLPQCISPNNMQHLMAGSPIGDASKS